MKRVVNSTLCMKSRMTMQKALLSVFFSVEVVFIRGKHIKPIQYVPRA